MAFKKILASAFAVAMSGNQKLGKSATTYGHKLSCPDSCPWKNNGCYGETGPVDWHIRRLLEPKTVREVAVDEAIAIINLPGKLPLRLHTYGDCKTNEAARIVSEAAAIYTEKQNQPVWTYTHGWKDALGRLRVQRASWGKVSVLASCETGAEVKKAQDAGYATAMVVPEFPNGHKVFERDGIEVLPCLEMSGLAADCASCKVCFDDQSLLAKGLTIGFAPHGIGKAKVFNVLEGR